MFPLAETKGKEKEEMEAKPSTPGLDKQDEMKRKHKMNKRYAKAEMTGILDLSSSSAFSFGLLKIPSAVYSALKDGAPLSSAEAGAATGQAKGGGKQEKAVKMRQLWLSNNSIAVISPEISLASTLTTLGLAQNSLQSLPAEIGRLVNLRRLLLYGNRLTALPSTIVNMTSLEELRLDRNRLPAMPAKICHIRSLLRLGLSGNTIGPSIPFEIKRLINLVELDLDNNLIEKLPVTLARLSHSLQSLGLENNRLSEFPTVINQLKHLDVLRIGANRASTYTVTDPESGEIIPGAHIPKRHDGFWEFKTTVIVDDGNPVEKQVLLEGLVPDAEHYNRENASWLREEGVHEVELLKARALRKEWKTENRIPTNKTPIVDLEAEQRRAQQERDERRKAQQLSSGARPEGKKKKKKKKKKRGVV